MSNSQKHIGTPPGTLTYTGEESGGRIKITLIEYNEQEFFEKEFDDLSNCMEHVKPNMVKWINVEGLHKIEVIEKIGQHYNIHPLTLEDIVHVNQRAKFEEFDHYVVSIMRMINYTTEIESEQLAIVLTENNTVISFQEPHNGDAFDIIRTRLRAGKGRIRKLGADYLNYALMDAVVDCYFVAIEKIGEKIEVIEELILSNDTKHSHMELYHLKRELIYLRRQIWPMRDLINNVIRSETVLMQDSIEIYLRDLSDHVSRIIDSLDTYRDLLSGIMDISLSTNANKMNEVMKVLTIMSSIFIPVTFIAGVYGMNFENMPELKTQNGYYITWIIMLSVIIGLLFYFKRKKWM